VRRGAWHGTFVIALAGLAALVAACAPLGGDEDARIPESALSRLVLQPADLAAGFTRFDEGAQGIADRPPGERADPQRFGRKGGWKARFRRLGSARAQGPRVVESRADLFGDPDGAEEELDAHRVELEQLYGAVRDVESLGDEAFAAAQDLGAESVAVYAVAWRYGNVAASISANGFSGRVTLDDVVRLARAQQRRIAAAAER
jgi:hypothetical protein